MLCIGNSSEKKNNINLFAVCHTVFTWIRYGAALLLAVNYSAGALDHILQQLTKSAGDVRPVRAPTQESTLASHLAKQDAYAYKILQDGRFGKIEQEHLSSTCKINQDLMSCKDLAIWLARVVSWVPFPAKAPLIPNKINSNSEIQNSESAFNFTYHPIKICVPSLEFQK